MKRLLILDGSIFREIYSPTAGWAQFLGDVPYTGVHLPSGETIPDLAGYTHLIVTGSEASITTEAPWYEVEAGAIRAAVERGMPVLASCFGHQMLAWALSGKTFARTSPTPEVGWISLDLLAPDPLLAGIPNPAWCFASHFDEVWEPPAPWRVLARSQGCPVQVMRFGDQPVWGVQAHPEITPPEAKTLLAGAGREFPDQAHLFQAALGVEPRDDGFAGRLVENFLAAKAFRT